MTVAGEAPAPPLNAQTAGEISKIFEDEGIVAKGSLSSSADNYASWKMDRDEVSAKFVRKSKQITCQYYYPKVCN